MNYIKHLTGFFDRVVNDTDLNPTHISLYISLFQFWNVNRFQNPICISRDEIMRISKIAGKATYHKCMKDLNNKGYVKYEPSYNPFKGSMVILYNFADEAKPVQKMVQHPQKIAPNNEQALNKSRTGYETGTEQALVPSINYINNTNILNDLNVDTIAKNENENDSIFKKSDYPRKEKSFAKKEMPEEENLRKVDISAKLNNIPSLDEIKIHFLEQSYPEQEAHKFFNHYASNGWLVGGKSPMVDWKAATANWMMNSQKFHSVPHDDRAKNLNVNNNKNYAEPL